MPVRAWPIRSVPIRATERVISWIGNGVDDADALEGVGDLGEHPELSEGGQDLACSVVLTACAESVDSSRSRCRRRAARSGVSTSPGASAWARRPRSEVSPSVARGHDRASSSVRLRAMADTPGRATDSVAFEDPAYRAAVVDLLGAIAYGEISAFERLADDAKLAPTLRGQGSRWRDGGRPSSATSSRCCDRHRRARRRPDGGDGAVREAASTSSTPHTAPRDWLEGLIKAYVGDGLAADFYRRDRGVPRRRHPRPDRRRPRRRRPRRRSSSTGCGRAIEADHRVGGRLALWGRRLMGEALSQAQRVAAERDALTALLAGGVDRPAWTSPRWAGCSPGSPRTTRSGWPSSASTAERAS